MVEEMVSNSEDSQMIRVVSYVSKHIHFKLKAMAIERETSMVRLVSIAVDNEMQREKPFYFNYTIPTEQYIEFAYANEAGKILNYMNTFRNGVGLDVLLLLRYDMDIHDKETFLLAFRELIEKKMVDTYKPANKTHMVYADDYYHYRVAGTSHIGKRKARKKASKYARYVRLKKEFEKDKEL